MWLQVEQWKRAGNWIGRRFYSAFPAFISKVEETEKRTDNSTRSGDEDLSDDELGEEFHNELDDESEYSFDEFSSSSDEE